MNCAIMCGRLTRDPEVKYTQGEKPMCIAKFSIAIDRKGRDNGADYPNIIAFGKTGEFCEKYLKKGTKVNIRSHVQTGSYTNRDGNKVYTTDFVVDEIEFAESKAASAQTQNTQTTQQTQTQPTQQTAPANNIDAYVNIPDSLDGELPFA